MKGPQSCKLFALAAVLAVAAATVAHAQTFKVLYNFGSKTGDPYSPEYGTRIAQGRDGDLYATGTLGGATGNGAAFKITPSGKLTVLYSFCSQQGCSDGQIPFGGLTLGTDGSFYGTTENGGGSADAGIVYKMTRSGTLTVLHVINGASDGGSPQGPPVEGLDGNFYGTTSSGGSGGGCGTIYKITPSGTYSILYRFVNAATDACSPHSPLVLGTDGNFYGTASYGAYDTFMITPSGKYKPLTPNTELVGMDGPLIQGTNAFFYGADSANQIFKMSANGNATILYTLNGTTDGNTPRSGVVQASDSKFYGTTQSGGTNQNCSSNLGTCGVLFKITPHGSYSVLHDFEDPDGYELDAIMQHTSGIIYGQATFGGTANGGTFWSWNARLHAFVSLLPYSGKVAKTIEFLGQNFTSSTTVSFNGTAASSTVVSSTYLTAAVPQGATTGPVTVTTSSGALTSNKIFRVTPQLLSFTPTSGPVGTQVTITGVSLTQTTKVAFGGVKASNVIVNSDTQVTAYVPTGAKTGHIGITTLGGTATSSGIFTVTQ
jgi:uncharacterized repeat protein (TIGR03803 family)